MLCQMRLRQVGLDSLQTVVKQGLLVNVVFWTRRQMKFDTVIHRLEGLVDCVHIDFRGPKAASLGRHRYSLLLMIYPMF